MLIINMVQQGRHAKMRLINLEVIRKLSKGECL